MKRFVKVICIVFLLAMSAFATAQATSVSGLYQYKLDNGLSLYVMENDCAPLTYIEISVKAGAVAQSKENAGLFHLYEHMMFKGNIKFPTAKDVTNAMTQLGVTAWNGSTAVDYVNYYFTVPCDMLEEGLEFWSYAIRSPLLDAKEFEREKQVVIAEINGNYSNPAAVAFAAITKTLFPDNAYRQDPSGSVQSISNATVDDMRKMKDTYYVPDNAALFVGGSVKHDDVYAKVKTIFGDWKKSNKARVLPQPPTKAPLKQNKYLVYANEQIPEGFTTIYYCLRGPDTQTDMADTYGMDLLLSLSAVPNGAFENHFLKDNKIHFLSEEYINLGYTTQKASGLVSFSAMLSNDDTFDSVPKRASYFVEDSIPRLCKNIISNKDFFDKNELKNAKSGKDKEKKYATETAEGYLSILRYWWNVCDIDYALSYDKRFIASTKTDIDAVIKKYISDKAGVVMVQVNPATYKAQEADFTKAGYEVVTKDNAFWFLGE